MFGITIAERLYSRYVRTREAYKLCREQGRLVAAMQHAFLAVRLRKVLVKRYNLPI